MSTLAELIKWNDEGRLPVESTSAFYEALVPKDPIENLAWREFVLTEARDNAELQDDLFCICSRDLLFYVNTFIWTYIPKGGRDSPVIPMITWEFQDRIMSRIADSYGVRDHVICKSRDVGATWMNLIVVEWKWHFQEYQKALVTSRKEDLVDKTGDEKALMQKLDFIHRFQPDWLLPEGRWLDRKDPNRTKLHLGNADNNSSIDGEASVADQGRGDRLHCAFRDEFAFQPNGSAIDKAQGQATDCRITNSTPNGRFGDGAQFYKTVANGLRLEKKYGKDSPVWVDMIHWSEDPRKRDGLYLEHPDGRLEIVEDPDNFDWRDYYDFDLMRFTVQIRSPWYDGQCEREDASPENIAQELNLDFMGSVEKYVDTDLILNARNWLKGPLAMPMTRRGRLIVTEDLETITWDDKQESGPWKLWLPLWGQGQELHPPPGEEYGIGVDVSAGTGGEYSSNSTAYVVQLDTGEHVATFASNNILPADFAILVVGACKWFNNAFLVPEINGGPGATFMKTLRDLHYWNVYVRDGKTVDAMENRKMAAWGYFNRDSGATLLDCFQKHLRAGTMTCNDITVLDECLEYEYKNGKLFHAGSQMNESESDKGMAHGDRAIAAGCAALAIDERGNIHRANKQAQRESSYAKRRRVVEEMRKQELRKNRSSYRW